MNRKLGVRRGEGFEGQRLVVLPESVLSACRRDPLLTGLCPVRAGFFPRARGHYVERLHGCPETVVLACLAGSGQIRQGGRLWKLAPGHAAFLAAGKSHAYAADATDPWTLEWVHVIGKEMGAMVRMLGVHEASPILSGVATDGESAGLGAVVRAMEQGYARLDLLDAATECRSVFRDWARRSRLGDAMVSSSSRVDETVRWMRNHLREMVRLEDLARRAGLSVPHFRALFRQRTGYPPVEFFHRLRIQEACHLLGADRMRVQEVAERIGYADPYYFSRVFRRVMGCAPSEFRKKLEG